MSAGDLTDIICRFTDALPAEVLAKFIADSGLDCSVAESADAFPFGTCFGIRVARKDIPELKKRLVLVPIAHYGDSISAQILAGRLARENIPSYLGGLPVTGVGPYGVGYSGEPIDEDGTLGLNTVAVPRSYVDSARRSLNDQVSDAELEELALGRTPESTSPP